MAEYKGTVKLIAGITQTNGDFALVNAPDVQVDSTGKRLDLKLNEMDASNRLKAPIANPVFTGTITLGPNTISGTYSAAIGTQNSVSGNSSFATGSECTVTERFAHAEGSETNATGIFSHAEGSAAIASGTGSHAEGTETVASGMSSHAEGRGTIVCSRYSHVGGKYNIPFGMSNAPSWSSNTLYKKYEPVKNDNHYYICATNHTSESTFDSTKWVECGIVNDYMEVIGNGTSNTERSNARALDISGNEYLCGNIYVNCNADSTGGYKLMSNNNIASASTVQAIIDGYGR